MNKKSDLYIYFYYHGLALLRPSGIFCFINSNSWLDVGYGASLQEFLLKNMDPLCIVDNQAKRSFKESDVNTIIVAVKRPEEVKDATVRFVNYKKPFEEVLTPDNLIEIERSSKVTSTDDFRVFPITKKELLEDGVELPKEKTLLRRPEDLPYIGSKWGGKYLRAPDIFFKILKKGKGKLVRLGDIAEVRFGIKTGANEFFYLEPTGQSAPKGLMHVRNGIGWEGFLEERFLKPVIKSPREIKTLRLYLENLRYRVFMCHGDKFGMHQDGMEHALAYIQWGERRNYHRRPTCAIRQRWWDLGEPSLSNFLWTMTYRQRFFIAENNKVYADARMYDIYCPQEIGILLNSSCALLWMELQARGYGGGGGPVDVKVYEVNNMFIIEPDIAYRQRLLSAFDQMATREIKNIFEELGLPKPNRDYSNIDPNDVSLDKVMLDRRELDRIIFESLGLTEEEQLEVYRAVVELVKNRLVKARSV